MDKCAAIEWGKVEPRAHRTLDGANTLCGLQVATETHPVSSVLCESCERRLRWLRSDESRDCTVLVR